MVVYVLCVQRTVCFSLVGLSFLWLEGGQYLWAVLVWTRKCGWYSFRNLWPIGMDVVALRHQRPMCSWLAFVKLTKCRLLQQPFFPFLVFLARIREAD